MIAVDFNVILFVCRDFLLSPWFWVTAVKISVLCVISSFEWSLMYTRKPWCGKESALCRCNLKFNTYRNLQQHRAVLPAIARLLSIKTSGTFYAKRNISAKKSKHRVKVNGCSCNRCRQNLSKIRHNFDTGKLCAWTKLIYFWDLAFSGESRTASGSRSQYDIVAMKINDIDLRQASCIQELLSATPSD